MKYPLNKLSGCEVLPKLQKALPNPTQFINTSELVVEGYNQAISEYDKVSVDLDEEKLKLSLVIFIGDYMSKYAVRHNVNLKFSKDMSDIVRKHAKALASNPSFIKLVKEEA